MKVYAVFYPSYYYDVDSIWSTKAGAIKRAKKIKYDVEEWKLDSGNRPHTVVAKFWEGH